MLFHSLPFLFGFLPIVLALYWQIGKAGVPALNLWFLAAASLAFYGAYHPGYVPLLAGSILVNYAIGARVRAGRFRKIFLAAGIAANVVLLGYYKYANFLVENANLLLAANHPLPNIVLPLAISFFTFQQITYLVDQYRGEVREQGFLRYAVCVLFFPHLIAGPIVHYRKMMPQFTRPVLLGLRADHLAAGASLLALGLFKKICIADVLAGLADPAFSDAAQAHALTFSGAWIAALAFTFQIYFDFSGYTDMALGLARMFGIRLPDNFRSPYKAGSIIEFWRRWHITLSRFLRDYLYIPLGGGRKGPIRQLASLMITMFIAGLWHGAAWNFVWWGLIHGAALSVNHLWRRLRPDWLAARLSYRIFSFALTFLTVVFAWVFFRAADWDAAWRMLGAMADWRSLAGSDGMKWGYAGSLLGAALLCAVVFAMPSAYQLARGGGLLRWKMSAGWALAAAVLLVAAILRLVYLEGRVQEFIYWKF